MIRQHKITLFALALACSTACADGTRPLGAGSDTDGGNSGSGTTEDNPQTLDTNEVPPGCGDGKKSESEDCDDGNLDDTDGCLHTCTLAYCGDGYVHEDIEECDDANDIDDDGCTSDCTPPACGDGVLHPDEDCDDGNESNNDECLSICTVAVCGDGFTHSGVEQCDDGNDVDADLCTSECVYATCGDGQLQGDEACDDGNDSYFDACLPGCEQAECGDGFVWEGTEACDDADDDNYDECLNNCAAAQCGDGVVHAGVEACDDGNGDNGDACTNACGLADCGDGFIQNGEQCDDDNSSNTDACLSSCVLATCGDGYLRAGFEDCDDGNTNNHDGCLSTCTPALSCRHIKSEIPNASSGVYRIDPDGPGGNSPREVRCDMSTDGGGWTLVASSRNFPPQDQASAYYDDLQSLTPISAHSGIWDGMRPLALGQSDIRFTCSLNPNSTSFAVDLSFYDIWWYEEITTGSDAQSCFSEGNGYGDDQPEPARRNNRTGHTRSVNNSWNKSYLEGEDYCSDAQDFGVDFDDRGMDSGNDGTDWGLDDGVRRCRYYNIGTGAWHIWVREN